MTDRKAELWVFCKMNGQCASRRGLHIAAFLYLFSSNGVFPYYKFLPDRGHKKHFLRPRRKKTAYTVKTTVILVILRYNCVRNSKNRRQNQSHRLGDKVDSGIGLRSTLA